MMPTQEFAVSKWHTQGCLQMGCCGMQVSVMHAFIDEGDYSNTTIDKALRMMLKDFKLPGELFTDNHRNHSLQNMCSAVLCQPLTTLQST